jgi:hypothetical protein
MAKRKRTPRVDLDRPGQPPLLQGHLRPGGMRAGEETSAAAAPRQDPAAETPRAGDPASAKPASETAKGPVDAARGKATRSPAEVATRPHLEGAEQGPM